MDNDNKQDAGEPTPASAGSVALQQCILGVISLHRLISSGQGDSDKADAVRDSAEVHFSTLTSDEAAVVQTLSAELYRPALTGAEREALEWFTHGDSPFPEEASRMATVRGLLERTK